jgi:hypothetical protein
MLGAPVFVNEPDKHASFNQHRHILSPVQRWPVIREDKSFGPSAAPW